MAVDLVARMVRLQREKRLRIDQVAEHPLFWDAAAQIEKVRGWKISWRRGLDLKRRLAAHPCTVAAILGGSNTRDGGWLSALDPAVAAQLSAWKDGYDGRDVLDPVRAIRNVFDHWFERISRDTASDA